MLRRMGSTGAVAAAAAIAVLVAYAFWNRYEFLSASPYPVGIDGYYYPIQLRSILESGGLYYSSAPLALYLMAPLAAAWDPITGAKLGAALGGALIAVPVYLVGRRVSGDRAAGILAAVLATASASSFFVGAEFVKSSVGITVAVTHLAVLGWALERPTRGRAIAALATFAAALATHKLAAAFAAIASVPPLAVAYPALEARARRVVAVAAVAGGIAVAVLAAGHLALLGGLFGAADWRLPVLAPGRGAPPLVFGREVAIGGALAVVVVAIAIARRRWPRLGGDEIRATDRALAWGPAALALLAALPIIDVTDPQELGFRLRAVAYAPMAICAAAALAPLARATEGGRTVAAAAFAAGWLAAMPAQPREGVVFTHPAMVTAVSAARDVVGDDDVIVVPERKVMFMTAWYTRAYARLRPEPVPPPRRWRMLTFYFTSPQLKAALDRLRAQRPPGVALPVDLHPGNVNGLVLVPEATWTWLLRQLPPQQQRRYEAWPTI